MTPEQVRERLDEAGRTLLSLPTPERGRPRDHLTYWPDTLQSRADINAQIIDPNDPDDVKYAERLRNRVRLVPTAREIGRMEEALEWLWFIQDKKQKGIVLSRSLVHPVTEKRPSYRKIAEKFHISHEAARTYYSRGLELISRRLRHQQTTTRFQLSL